MTNVCMLNCHAADRQKRVVAQLFPRASYHDSILFRLKAIGAPLQRSGVSGTAFRSYWAAHIVA